MNSILALVLVSLLAVAGSSSADGRTNVFNFKNLEVWQMLEVHKQLTGLALVTDSSLRVVQSVPIRLKTDRPVSNTEAAQLIEQALLEQAGVLITRLDDKRASVTWNGTRPAKPSSGRGANSGPKKPILTANDVDPQSVRTFPWNADTTAEDTAAAEALSGQDTQRNSAEPKLRPRPHVEVAQGLTASATNAVLNLVLTAPSSLPNWSNKTVGHYGLMKSIFNAHIDKRTGGYYERRLLAIRPEGFVMMFAEWDTGMPQTNIVLFRYGEITETNTTRWKIVGQFER